MSGRRADRLVSFAKKTFKSRFERAVGRCSQEAEPVSRSEMFEQGSAACPVVTGAAHEAQSERIGRVLHGSSLGDAAAASVSMDDVREFVTRSERELIVVSRECDEPGGNRHVARIAVCVDAAIGYQHQPGRAVLLGYHLYHACSAASPDANAQRLPGGLGGDLVKQRFGDQRPGFAPLGNDLDVLTGNGVDLITRQQAGPAGGAACGNRRDHRAVFHTQRLGQQRPILPRVSAPIIKREPDIGGMQRARMSGRVSHAPFDFRESRKVLTITNWPRRVRGGKGKCGGCKQDRQHGRNWSGHAGSFDVGDRSNDLYQTLNRCQPGRQRLLTSRARLLADDWSRK